MRLGRLRTRRISAPAGSAARSSDTIVSRASAPTSSLRMKKCSAIGSTNSPLATTLRPWRATTPVTAWTRPG